MDVELARDASAQEFGRSLKRFGINLLVKEVEKTAVFLRDILGMEIHRADYDGNFFQLHADHTYQDNPLPEALKRIHYRGSGVELRLNHKDPDVCEGRAKKNSDHVFRTSLDRPHGLRECYLLDPDGYCWVPSARLEK